MPTSQKQVVLVGIGHTNAHVLSMWRKSPPSSAQLVCVSNFPVATYSGMLPGSLAGQYAPKNMEINLKSLAQAARAKLLLGPALGVDPEAQVVHVGNHAPVRFDVLSVGVGSVPNMAGVDVTGHGPISIKPMQTFQARLYEGLESVERRNPGVVRVVVVGAGVGGIEITLCLPKHLNNLLGGVEYDLTVIDAHGRVGSGLSPRALHRVEKLLGQRGVNVITGERVVRVADDGVVLANGERVGADLVVWATAAAPPPIHEKIALPKDPRGFLLTHDTLQSTGAANIFVVGDSGTVAGVEIAKAGVYAVREGPVLWRNILALLRGTSLVSYEPQHDFLRLLNTGDGKAIMDYRGWVVHARWCWLLKDWIDGRFMSRFRMTRG